MRLNRFTRTTALVTMASTMIWAEAIGHNESFDLHIMNVRSLERGKRVGFNKAWELYAVTAYGPKMSYVLYCTKAAPETGRVYTALDEYVSADLSWLPCGRWRRKALIFQRAPRRPVVFTGLLSFKICSPIQSQM